MWPFKRKQPSKHTQSGPPCPYCMSNNTKAVASSQLTGKPDYIKTWKGQRYITCRCSECGRDFYVEATLPNIGGILPTDENIVEGEDELAAAEEELKRRADEENDHRFKGNM
jgi:hypothetical protein